MSELKNRGTSGCRKVDSGCFEEYLNADLDYQSTQESASRMEKTGTHPVCPFCAINSKQNQEVRFHVAPNEKNLETQLTEEQLFSISEHIGETWHELGHKLGILYTALQNINEELPTVKKKAITVLMRWWHHNGKKATVDRLAHALVAVGRRDVAETLTGGDPLLLQLTVKGTLVTRDEESPKCCKVCTDTWGGKTYLVSEIDKKCVVIDGDMLTAKVTWLWEELRCLESPFTIGSDMDVKAQLEHCENINRRLQGLDTQLLNLTGEAGQTENLPKMETIQSIMVLQECNLMLLIENTDLANRIALLRRQSEEMEETQQMQLEILQTSQEGIPQKITRIDGILDMLMRKSVGSRNSAPNLSELEHVWPEKIAKFLSQSLQRRPGELDTKLLPNEVTTDAEPG